MVVVTNAAVDMSVQIALPVLAFNSFASHAFLTVQLSPSVYFLYVCGGGHVRNTEKKNSVSWVVKQEQKTLRINSSG